MIRGLLHEPLFHFLILGAAMFAASSLLSDDQTAREDEIVVSAGQIEHLVARFERTWRRSPTGDELAGLITDHVREEAAYREGIALGLDRDDTIIRRRVRQKLEFIATDVARLTEPSEEELEAYLLEHEEDFRIEPRFTFVHVFLDPQRRGDQIQRDALELLASLQRDPDRDPRTVGDRLMLPAAFESTTAREVGDLLGQSFAAGLDSLATPTGLWRGPVESGYGLHLVRVDQYEPGRLATLEDVRPVVRREWENDQSNALKEQYYDGLVSRHEVTIEWPDEVQPAEAP